MRYRTGAASIPKDNPFVERKGARPEIWSYGHRNPQGLTFNPGHGELWEQRAMVRKAAMRSRRH